MTILRDTLYSDRVLAVLREYSSNAWDAHRVSGRADVPIEVKLPTQLDPELSIRDHGPGLSCDEMFRVYTQYGESTKRDSDDFVGMLGIGSKSAFAYSDTFTVTSWKDGRKSIYVAALDESGKGRLDLLLQDDCDPAESGLEVKVAVKREDIDEFKERAQRLFPFFTPRPKINIDLVDPLAGAMDIDDFARMRRRVGYNDNERGWWAMMGCVAYKVDLSQLGRSLPSFMTYFSGVVYVPIGGAHVNASREGLKYSELTRQTVGDLLERAGRRYTELALERLETGKLSPWECIKAVSAMRSIGLPLPKAFEKETFPRLELDASKEPFTFAKAAERRYSYFNEDTVVLIRDDNRSIRGYDVSEGGSRHILLVPRKGNTWTHTLIAARRHFAALGLEGIPIERLSTLPWVDRSSKNPRPVNTRHKARMFAYGGSEKTPLSKSWDPVDRDPEDSDVYVEIDHFEVSGCDFYSLYSKDTYALKAAGMDMPTVYGYKPRKPGDPPRKGQDYRAWRKGLIKTLRETPGMLESTRTFRLTRILPDLRPADSRAKRVVDRLGESHHISRILTAMVDSLSVKLHQNTYALNDMLNSDGAPDEDQKAIMNLRYRYPLLELNEQGLRAIGAIVLGYNSDAWVEYIMAIDLMKDLEEK